MTLQFVLNHFVYGRLDYRQSFKGFLKATGLKRKINWYPYASAAAAILIVVFLLCHNHNSWKEYTAYDITQTFTLADGTQVTLAPGATVSVQEHRNPRHVSMSGQALFTVAKDPEHPFVVTSPQSRIEVLGTVFSITEADKITRVDVTEGHVMASALNGNSTELHAGESALLSDGFWSPLTPSPNPTAWATGSFVYDAVPLADVLNELSAYYGKDIIVPDTDKRLTAEFSTDMPLDEILGFISLALNVDLK